MDIEGGMFGRHLGELADQIEWKLQILAHSCPVDWKGSADYEETAQVNTIEKSGDPEFSPGYVGGQEEAEKGPGKFSPGLFLCKG